MTNKPSHTPGPWVCHSGAVWKCGKDVWPSGLLDGVPICRMDRETEETTPCERDANARLIAAAPDLLEVCNHALLLLSGLSTDGEVTMTPEGKDRITAELRAAIAKAEGRV